MISAAKKPAAPAAPAGPDVGVIGDLLNRPAEPAWGAGEASIGCLPGAIANAVFNATGARVRSLPITPAVVKAALPA